MELNTQSRRLVYLSEGLWAWFAALADSSTVVYLCSTTYNPSGEHEVDPFDPDLAIDWGLSRSRRRCRARDAAAPGLAGGESGGTASDYAVCRGLRGVAGLKAGANWVRK